MNELSEITILTARLRGSRVVLGCLGIYRFLAGELGHSRSVSLRLRSLFFFLLHVV